MPHVRRSTTPGIISVRQGAERLGIREESIYRAKRRGTIMAATGPGIPEGIWFEAAEFERWAANREQLRKLGPKGTAA